MPASFAFIRMDSVRPNNPKNVLTLKQAASCLAVSVDVLLKWNEYNILKPTITNTGEIGYFQEQIDQFIAIQKFSQINNITENTKIVSKNNNLSNDTKNDQPFINLKTETSSNFSQINNYNFYSESPTPIEKNKTSISSFGIIGTFLFFIISISAILFSQQNKIDSLIYQNQISSEKRSEILTSGNPNQSPKINDRVENNSVKSTNLNNEGNPSSQNKIASLGTIFENKEKDKNSFVKSNNDNDKVAILSTMTRRADEKNTESGSNSVPEVRSYSQKANFATSSTCPTCSKKSDTDNIVFDSKGNIKVSKEDTLENKLLSTSLGIAGITQNQNSTNQNSNSIILFSYLIIFMISLYAFYTRKNNLPLIPARSIDTATNPVNFIQEIEKQKVLEIGQKTDGTVVINFKGKEYKVSKPELDSESDKFIERLMQLVTPGIKEIEYDSLQDDKLTLSAPLSKIVTRLGFVGIKRDLFFPRTSKSRVVFRKYITQEDLLSMNLNAEQISSGFTINY